MDSFGRVGEASGSTSESQEQRLARAPFLKDSPQPSPAGAGGDDDDDVRIFLSASSSDAFRAHSPAPLFAAGAPILMCSLPDSPAPDSAPTLDAAALAKDNSPAPAPPEPSTAKKSLAHRRRSRGARINTDVNDDPSPEPTRENPNEIHRTTNPPPGSRKLPAWVTRPPEEEGNRPQSGPSATAADPPPEFPTSLLDVINAFSRKPNRRFGDADILDVAKQKGIEFPNPQWWRPEGYELKSEEELE